MMDDAFDVAIDVGGTFTDFVVSGPAETRYFKYTSTPTNAVEGILGGLTHIASNFDMPIEEFLGRLRNLALGTTVATNAILEHRTARTALITTRGFRDTLLIREGGKPDTYNIRVDYPAPFIPRHLTYGVTERVAESGTVLVRLDEDQARSVVAEIVESGAEAIAVSLLWSITNPSHEIRIGEIISELAPDLPFSLGHKVSPIIREYRRTSTASIDASLKPIVQRNITEVQRRLCDAGFAGSLSVVTSSGGRISGNEAAAKPVHLCLSGPSGAPQASSRIAELEGLANGNVITVDMGGTSFDVSIMTNGETATHREGMVGGHIFAVPSIDIVTIGAGGGSIASIDIGGMLHVGPGSAGAFPGPACYGRGGREPTVTDANLVRGLLSADSFAGGSIRLSEAAAREAVKTRVADPLGISMEQAAGLICAVVEQNMGAAIDEITVKRGVDPREYTLVCGGAAAGAHIVSIASALGIRKVVVPRSAGVLSAYGIASGDIKMTFSRAHRVGSDAFDFDGVARALLEAKAEADAFLELMRVPPAKRVLRFSTQACYRGQVWNLTLPLQQPDIRTREHVALVVEDFHALHERLYSVRSETDGVEFSEWSVEAVGLSERKSDTPPARSSASAEPRAGEVTVLWTGAGERVEAPVYRWDDLAPGKSVEGPAVIRSELTAILIERGASAGISPSGNLVVDVLPA